MEYRFKFFSGILIIISIFQVGNSQNPKDPSPVFIRAQNATTNCPKMLEWDSLFPKESFYVNFPIEYVVIHHTMGHRCFRSILCKQIVKNIQVYSMNVLSLPDIKYNFLIGEDKNIYQGTGWFRKGFHTSNEIDSKSISIAFIGDFSDEFPEYEAIDNLNALLKCGKAEKYFKTNYKVVAAFQVEKSTNSPGRLIFEELKKIENFVNNENDTM